MYLVTTALHEFWPEQGPVLLLTPGCCPELDDPKVISRWDIKGIVSDPFRETSDMTAAYTEIWRISDALIGLLAERLNHIHGTQYSERYWRTLIGFWVLFFVSVVYDRHTRLLQAKSEMESIEVIGNNDMNHYVPSDTDDFTTEATGDLYNSQIYTYLCNKLEIPIIEYRSAANLSNAEKFAHSFRKSLIKKMLLGILNFSIDKISLILGHRAKVLMVASYLPRRFEILLSIATFGKVFPLYPKKISTCKQRDSSVNTSARTKLSEISDKFDGVAALILEMVGMCIPRSFVEDYQGLCSQSDNIYKNYRPKAIYSANALYFDETFKHWAGKSQEYGTKIIGGLHGGAGFIQKYGKNVSFEILLSDHYLTWGWSGPNDAKLYPTPACKLIDIDKRPNCISGDGILYVGTAAERHQVTWLSDFSNYIIWQKKFFSSIPHDLLGEFTVRQHYMDYGWLTQKRLTKAFPDIQNDNWEMKFRDKLKKCRLYVSDHLSTSYTEALASNVPTILFWSESLYPIRDTARPYFQALKECHIFHDSPESAAAWVAKVYDDPSAWWLSKPCQKAVEEFCYYFARTSQAPLKDWKKVFATLAK